MKINLSKTYKYRNGEPARVLCVDGASENYPVVSLTSAGEPFTHDPNGKFMSLDADNAYDLIEVLPLWEGGIWVHPNMIAVLADDIRRLDDSTLERQGFRKIQAKEVSQP